MKQLLIENLGTLLATLVTGFGAWFFGRKKANADVESSQIENAEKLLNYYKNIVDDLGRRQEIAIENLQKSEQEKQEVIFKFSEATRQIGELKQQVEHLTEELKKYKQLNGKTG
ncbi:hypothetical protein [Chryseobacterium sp.]|uniref:hypothetical protein n=1 Tax=Chryseobacterium sp. TaxID=1871047 RepID=UPI002898A5B1|nr:hypothetical protein [Chryseobacterium sp.]